MMINRAPTSALPDLRPGVRLAVLARPVNGVQGHRAACAAARGRRAAPHPFPAPAGLGRPRCPHRADPATTRQATDAPAGNTRHRPPMAPAPGHPEVDLPTPDGTTAS